MKINFKIVTPEKTVFESEIDQATLPVADGEVTILPNHRSYIAALKAGEIMLKIGKEEIIWRFPEALLNLIKIIWWFWRIRRKGRKKLI